MEDRMHQQYRKEMFPFEPLIEAALAAGAHGAYLSGAGPTVLAITGGVGIADVGSDTMSQFLAEAVSAALLKVAGEKGHPGTVHISRATNSGMSSVGSDAAGKTLWAEATWQGGRHD